MKHLSKAWGGHLRKNYFAVIMMKFFPSIDSFSATDFLRAQFKQLPDDVPPNKWAHITKFWISLSRPPSFYHKNVRNSIWLSGTMTFWPFNIWIFQIWSWKKLLMYRSSLKFCTALIYNKYFFLACFGGSCHDKICTKSFPKVVHHISWYIRWLEATIL